MQQKEKDDITIQNQNEIIKEKEAKIHELKDMFKEIEHSMNSISQERKYKEESIKKEIEILNEYNSRMENELKEAKDKVIESNKSIKAKDEIINELKSNIKEISKQNNDLENYSNVNIVITCFRIKFSNSYKK